MTSAAKQTANTTHLDVIDLRLSHERARVETAKTDAERSWREHNVRMIEREREQEIAFLAKHGVVVEPAPTLDEILSALELLDAGASQTTLARCSSQVEEG